MLKVTTELNDFWALYDMCWIGAISTLNEIKRQGKENECMAFGYSRRL